MIKQILFIIISTCSHLSSADNGGCLAPWIASDTYCYYIGNSQSVSWAEAKDECNLRLGQLLRLESTKEAAFIKGYFKKYPAPAYWTALNDIDPSGLIVKGTGTWLWGKDEYPLGNVLKWNVEPDNSNEEDCCAINVQATFSDEPCSRRLGYICKLTLPADGSCPMYWLQGTNAIDCFYVSNVTDPTQLLTWKDAKTKCAGMPSVFGSPGPFLLTINSQQDANFWTKRLFQSWSVKSPMKYWTGLNDRQVEGAYVWDNSPRSTIKFVNWTKEPNNLAGMENCGVILDEGSFSDRDCRQPNGYICKKPQINQKYPVNFGCDDWVRAGQKCYYIFAKPKSNWLSARDHCRSLGGDLLKIENKDEQRWLNVQTKTGTVAWGGYWIGLNDIATKDHVNGWEWADGAKADPNLLNWDSSPNNVGGTSKCAAMFQDGVYSDGDCHMSKKGFICEKDYTGTCPSNWKLHGTSCYYFSQKWSTWIEALDKCKQLSGDNSGYPFAISDASEKTWILNQVFNVAAAPYSWWTGLTSLSEPGLWLYLRPQDNTKDVLSLVYADSVGLAISDDRVWATEPNNYRGAEDCTVVFQEGRLNDAKCSHTFGFICEKRANGVSHSSSYTSTSTAVSSWLFIALSPVIICMQRT